MPPPKARSPRKALASADPFAWSIVNDNRYEQHFDVWAAPALAGKPISKLRRLVFAGRCRPNWRRRPINRPGAAVSASPCIARLLPVLQDSQAEACRSSGREELARAIEPVAQYFRALGEGKSPAAPAGEDAGSVLVSVLVDSQLGRHACPAQIASTST